jgi:hypothetical protein
MLDRPVDEAGEAFREQRRHGEHLKDDDELLEHPTSGGATVTLASSKPSLVAVPASVLVSAGATSAKFTATTVATRRNATVTISASYAGVTKAASLTVTRR